MLIVVFIGFGGVKSPSKSDQKLSAKWEAVMETEGFKKDKAKFLERMEGKNICWDKGVDNFLKNDSSAPDPKCLYHSSRFMVGNEAGKNILMQETKRLKIFQVIKNGFLVEASGYDNDRKVFIFQTDEVGIVDGSYLDGEHNWDLYRYVGPFKYKTMLGVNTVYAFTKISKDSLRSTLEELSDYSPYREFYIKNGLWDMLDKR